MHSNSSAKNEAEIYRFIETGIPFCQFLKMKVIQLTPELVQILLPFQQDLIGDPRRPALHGGVIATLLDTAGGAISMTRLDLGRETLSTIDMRIDYLLPAQAKDLIGEARIVRKGNKVVVTQMRAFHPNQENAVADSRAVYNISNLRSVNPI